MLSHPERIGNSITGIPTFGRTGLGNSQRRRGQFLRQCRRIRETGIGFGEQDFMLGMIEGVIAFERPNGEISRFMQQRYQLLPDRARSGTHRTGNAADDKDRLGAGPDGNFAPQTVSHAPDEGRQASCPGRYREPGPVYAPIFRFGDCREEFAVGIKPAQPLYKILRRRTFKLLQDELPVRARNPKPNIDPNQHSSRKRARQPQQGAQVPLPWRRRPEQTPSPQIRNANCAFTGLLAPIGGDEK